MSRPVHVVGVGMIPFTKPGASEAYDGDGQQGRQLALDDAGIDYALVQQAYVGYVLATAPPARPRSTAWA
jgi:hypothetical protein